MLYNISQPYRCDFGPSSSKTQKQHYARKLQFFNQMSIETSSYALWDHHLQYHSTANLKCNGDRLDGNFDLSRARRAAAWDPSRHCRSPVWHLRLPKKNGF